jgi:adenylate cyclase
MIVTMRMRWTLGRAMVAGLLLTGVVVATLVWTMLAAWQRSIIASAESLRSAATHRATRLVEDYLGHLKRVVADVERRQAAGVCKLDDADGARACLLGSVAPDDALAEASFISAAGWQASAFREPGDRRLCTRATLAAGGGFVATRRCGDAVEKGAASDPRANPTYEVPADERNVGRLIWSDLSYAALDADLPEPQRRVVVHALQGLRTANGRLLGVLRVALLERQLDDAFGTIRVNEEDARDPFRVFLADDRGRLITRFRPSDRLRDSDDDLRIAPADVPPAVAQALAAGAARGYDVSFAELPGTQDWRVGVIGPSDYYLAAPRRTRRIIAAAALGALALMALALALATRAMRRGLDRVVASTERMHRFDLAPAATATTFADVESVLSGLERAKTAMRALGKYAPIDLVRRLYGENSEPVLGGELRTVTLMFTDIKDFTTFAEALPPERLAALLGCYFEAMTAAVTAHGGTVDKYIGDALMVMWNAPVPCADHAARACRAALACVEATAALFASEAWRGVPPLTTRFGINTDEVMVGHFGAPERFSYTALGDGVNLAARLEGLNKQYGTTILVSAAVVAAVGDGELVLRAVDRVTVKGKTRAVDVFELQGRRR